MTPMSEDEQNELRQSSNWDLRERMERNRKDFGLDGFPQFAWNAWRGEILWARDGKPQVVARIQVAGMLSARNKTWTWAWALALPENVRQAALRVRELGEERGDMALFQAKWPATEQDAWTMTAIVNKLSDGQGAFKCPSPDGAVFLVLNDLRPATGRRRVFGAQVCSHVLDDGRPVLLVWRETDGEVLAFCGGDDDTASSTRSLSLDQLLAVDPSLDALSDMPDGWGAFRETPESEWVRSAMPK